MPQLTKSHADLDTFKAHIAEIQDLQSAAGLLGWDLETYMPEKAIQQRASQLGTLSKLAHEMLTSEKTAQLLDKVQKLKGLSPIDTALIREVQKDFEREQKIPVHLVQALSKVTSEANPIWAKARQDADFKQFAPILQQIITLNLEMAEALGYKHSPYDALLDLYEPELTVAQLDPLFKGLQTPLVSLLKQIQQSPIQIEDRFLRKIYSQDKQLTFSRLILEKMGFDFEAGRLDLSTHPFSSGSGIFDVRLTTRVFRNDAFSCLSSSMHEGGHGLYEQGIHPDLMRTGLDGGTSLGIHESQSRMWENLIGRSYPFWQAFFPQFKKLFPSQLKGIRVDQFYRAINQVRPSAIRVESDEVTYNLHIILRYQIEKDLIEGRLKVKDLPDAWNHKMTSLIGDTPKNDAEGVLQDVHWSHGSFGYFPTYTLGNLYSAQFFQTAEQAIPNLKQLIQKGKLLPLRDWLAQEIHQVGKMETPQEIIKRVSGKALDASYFTTYLKTKYTEIYKL